MYKTPNVSAWRVLSPLLLVLSFLLGCSLLGDEEDELQILTLEPIENITLEPVVDLVDSVSWQRVDEDTVICPGGARCLVAVQTVYSWSSGKTTFGKNCCLDCERYAHACQLGKQKISFRDTSLPLAQLIKIPAHWPHPGMVLWTREGGINSAIEDAQQY